MESIRTIQVIWDDLRFSKDHIHFEPARIKLIVQPVHVKGIIESLNLIKGSYFHRLYGNKAFSLTFDSGRLLTGPSVSPGWSRLLDAIEFAKQLYELEFGKKKHAVIHRANSLPNDDLLKFYDSVISRSDYLRYLAGRIGTEFRLIPIVEFSNGVYQDSFLFRFRNKRGHVLIVWENVEPGRATHVFKYEEGRHKNVLEKIESFIISKDFNYKRSLLSRNEPLSRQLKKELCYFKKYSHAGFSAFKAEIEYIIQCS